MSRIGSFTPFLCLFHWQVFLLDPLAPALRPWLTLIFSNFSRILYAHCSMDPLLTQSERGCHNASDFSKPHRRMENKPRCSWRTRPSGLIGRQRDLANRVATIASRGLAQNFIRIVFSPGILFARRSSCFKEFLFLESVSAVIFFSGHFRRLSSLEPTTFWCLGLLCFSCKIRSALKGRKR